MKISYYILVLVLIELFIGGPGNMISFFGISIREILMFSLFLSCLLISKFYNSFIEDSRLVFLIIFYSFISFFIGLINGNSLQIIINDIKPMLFFFLYFPVNFLFKNLEIKFNFFYRILLNSTFFLTILILFLYAYIAIAFGGDNWAFFYSVREISENELVWLRSSGSIFYPSMIFSTVCCILIFYKYLNYKISFYEIFIYFTTFLVIIFSQTKGFIFGLSIGHLLVLIFSKKKALSLSFLLFLTPVIFYLSFNFDFNRLRLDSYSSDRGVLIRQQTLKETAFKFNDSNLIFGNGYGTELKSKKFHQENSFLDILLEQGLIGIYLYMHLFYLLGRNFRNNPQILIITITLYSVSITNPYVNNPLGIGLLCIMLAYSNKKLIYDQ